MLSHGAAMQADVNRLKDQIQGASGDVDLLLTCEWPENLLLSLPPDSAPQGVNPSGTACLPASSSSLLTTITFVTAPDTFTLVQRDYPLYIPDVSQILNSDTGMTCTTISHIMLQCCCALQQARQVYVGVKPHGHPAIRQPSSCILLLQVCNTCWRNKQTHQHVMRFWLLLHSHTISLLLLRKWVSPRAPLNEVMRDERYVGVKCQSTKDNGMYILSFRWVCMLGMV